MGMRSRSMLGRWPLIVAVAAGLIGMHGLVTPLASAHDAGHGHFTAVDSTAVDSTAAGSTRGPGEVVTEAVTAMGGPGGCSGLCCRGHPCLAVLTAATGPISVAASVVAVRQPDSAPTVTRSSLVESILAARGPPTAGIRLSQLGVWRS